MALVRENRKRETKKNCRSGSSFFSFFDLLLNFPVLQARVVHPGTQEATVMNEDAPSSLSTEEEAVAEIEEEEGVPGPPIPGSPFYTSPEAVYVPFTTYPGQIMPRQLFAPSPSLSSSNKSPSSSSNISPSSSPSHSASNPTCSSPVSSITFSICSPATVCSTPPGSMRSTRFSSPYCQTSPRFPSPLSSPSPSPPPFPPSSATSTMTVASIHL